MTMYDDVHCRCHPRPSVVQPNRVWSLRSTRWTTRLPSPALRCTFNPLDSSVGVNPSASALCLSPFATFPHHSLATPLFPFLVFSLVLRVSVFLLSFLPFHRHFLLFSPLPFLFPLSLPPSIPPSLPPSLPPSIHPSFPPSLPPSLPPCLTDHSMG